MKEPSKEDKERIEKTNRDFCYDKFTPKVAEFALQNRIEAATAEHAHLSETIRELKADIALLKERDEKNSEGWAEDLKKLEAENQSLRDRVKWISVKDRLPDHHNNLIIFTHDHVVTKGYYCGENEWSGPFGNTKVTHWMLFPEPPLTQQP